MQISKTLPSYAAYLRWLHNRGASDKPLSETEFFQIRSLVERDSKQPSSELSGCLGAQRRYTQSSGVYIPRRRRSQVSAVSAPPTYAVGHRVVTTEARRPKLASAVSPRQNKVVLPPSSDESSSQSNSLSNTSGVSMGVLSTGVDNNPNTPD